MCCGCSTEGDEGYGDEIASDDGADELGTADQELKYNYVWICFKGSVSCGATTGDGHYVIVAGGACDPNATKPERSGTK